MTKNANRETVFHFKQFSVANNKSAMKVGSDSVLLGAIAGLSLIVDDTRRILDIGTGTGVLSLMLAQRFYKAEIIGVEVEEEAVEEADNNFKNSPFANRLKVVKSDIKDYIDKERFDFIICNPPYFNETLHSPSLQRAIARHDDTLTPLKLLECGRELLSETGIISIIYPTGRDEEIIYAASLAKLFPISKILIHTIEDKSPTRTIWEFASVERPTKYMHLSMRKIDRTPTEEYIKLVEPFYLHIK